MSDRFSYFVILGTMRSGSNFLEEQLNSVKGAACYGELFNPVFVGRHNQETFQGIDMIQREADPFSILDSLRQDDTTIGGFRYFDGHDPRVFDSFLQDTACAKIVLVRNPLDSFISLSIARSTGQWKLTNFTRRKSAQAIFDADAFDDYLTSVDTFYHSVFNGLAKAGQTAFFLNYNDLGDLSAFNGLLSFLGLKDKITAFRGKIKKQNPGTPASLVQNPDEMQNALRQDDRFSVARSLWFEPRRHKKRLSAWQISNPNLLCFSHGNPSEARFVSWMRSIAADGKASLTSDAADVKSFLSNSRDALRVALVEHPLRRTHAQFCNSILQGQGEYWERVRRVLKQQHGLNIPAKGIPKARWSLEAHIDAFEGFLRFLKLNISGLTSLPVNPNWATQFSLMAQASDYVCFDMVLKGPRLVEDAALLSVRLNIEGEELPPREEDSLFPLKDVVSPRINALAADAYSRDYEAFGFTDWVPERDLY